MAAGCPWAKLRRKMSQSRGLTRRAMSGLARSPQRGARRNQSLDCSRPSHVAAKLPGGQLVFRVALWCLLGLISWAGPIGAEHDQISRQEQLEDFLASRSLSVGPDRLRAYLVDPAAIAAETSGRGSLRLFVAELIGLRSDSQACGALWTVAADEKSAMASRMRAAEALVRMGSRSGPIEVLRDLVRQAEKARAQRSLDAGQAATAARSAQWLLISGDWSVLPYLLLEARQDKNLVPLSAILQGLHWGKPSQEDVGSVARLVEDLLVPGQSGPGVSIQIAEALIALHGVPAERFIGNLRSLADQPMSLPKEGSRYRLPAPGSSLAGALLKAIDRGRPLALGGRENSLHTSQACAQWRPNS